MNNLVYTGVFEADQFRVEEDFRGAITFLANLQRKERTKVSKGVFSNVDCVALARLTLILCPSGSV